MHELCFGTEAVTANQYIFGSILFLFHNPTFYLSTCLVIPTVEYVEVLQHKREFDGIRVVVVTA